MSRIVRSLRATAAVIVLAVVLAFGVSGCSARTWVPSAAPTPSAAALPTGSSQQTIEVGGLAREYRVFVPSGLTGPAPLVVMLHGGFGSAQQAENSYGWDAEATAQHFVVVYPNGLDHAWNVGGGCCGQPATRNVDDVGFITAVVHQVESRASVDPSRVYATGISNGGMMAYRLACDTSIFAAIGPDSATLLGDCNSPHPLSVIHIHGLADHNIPFDGGTGDGYAKIDGPPVQQVIASWSATDACGSPTSSTSGQVTRSIATCGSGRAVELITIAGAGHQWPGSEPRPRLEKLFGTDPPSPDLNATATIWAFFAAHPQA